MIDPQKDTRTVICPLCNGLGMVEKSTAMLIDRLKFRCHDLKRRIEEALSVLEKFKPKRKGFTIELGESVVNRTEHCLQGGLANYDGWDDDRIP